MKTEVITYSMGALKGEGALVYDEKISEKRPAVLMGPNWLGVTKEAIARAQLLAADRYVVFVADMYGQGVRPDFAAAPALANPLRENAKEHRARIRAAYDTLLEEGGKRNLIDDRRAAIGFCFGGGNVLELARDGADIAAAVSIHGDLKTASPAKKGAIKAALLVAHGAPDPVVPKADRDAFEAEMDAAGPSGRCWCSAAFCTPIPTRASTFPASPPGTSRRRAPPTRSPISSSPTRLRGNCSDRGEAPVTRRKNSSHFVSLKALSLAFTAAR
jgi:dienelactone hydrolase